ncbi:MAG: MBL fold metallo-hydrolase [Candidatus Paceibacteria bacterium]
MTLQWYGQSFFRIETQGKIIAIDPFSQDLQAGIPKPPKFRADLLLITHEHPDHNNISAIDGEPLIFRGPGEYEAKDIFIEGIASFHDSAGGKERGENTIFVIEAENIRLVHMGDFGEARLSESQEEQIGRVDVLLVPVGGHFTIGARQAQAIVNSLEPKVVIPMHYKLPGLKFPLDGPNQFLKEFGEKPEPQDKISFRAKDLQVEKTQFYMLRALSFEKK